MRLGGWLLALALLWQGSTAQAEPTFPLGQEGQARVPGLSVKGNPSQGNPLFVAAQGLPQSDVEVSWAGHKFSLGKTDRQGRIRALLAVPVDLKPGLHKLSLHLGDLEFDKEITVTPRHFELQRLSINADTLASYDNPQNKADDEAILRVIKKNDPVLRWSGSFRYPVDAPETTAFGRRRIYNGWKHGWHKGLDLGGREGQQVRAPGAGRVIHVARGLVNGNTVVLSHGCGLGTVYMHLQSMDVEMGEDVSAGQVIGRVGGTGGFAPHLHWEARVWGVPIEPKSLFQMPAGWR